jgi:hypothetical protein
LFFNLSKVMPRAVAWAASADLEMLSEAAPTAEAE